MDVAVTVSEDCLIKLWDLKFMNQDEDQLAEDTKFNLIEDRSEYNSYRGHTGIITKVVADQLKDSDDGAIFYTAGIEGIIRVWKVVKSSDVNQFGPNCDITSNQWMYIWEAHPNEIIWDLKHHNTQPMILSAGADDLISLWKTPSQDEIERFMDEERENRKLEDKIFIQTYQMRSNYQSYFETPTWIEWINTNSNHFVSWFNSGVIGLYDYTKESPLSVFSYVDSVNDDTKSCQINDVESHSQLGLIFTVSENRKIKAFDIQADGKLISCVDNAHEAPISSITFSSSGITYATSSHDGKIKFWDIRKGVKTNSWYGEISNAHRNKFGESIWSISCHPSLPILMSWGADWVVKLYTNLDF